MLVVHHLGRSQSERIVWLCEELELDYELRRYDRDPETRLAPPGYKALHPLGTAPVVEDGELVLGESAAIVDYIIARHGGGRLRPAADEPGFADYLYWFHFANGSLQALLHRSMIVRRLQPPADNPVLLAHEERLRQALGMVDARLGSHAFLAGDAFTAAEIMNLFCFTTMRSFLPYDIAPYPNLRAWLRRIGGREAYRRAMAKGDPRMAPLLD